MKALSKREKVLIFIMLVTGLVTLTIRFVIIPAYNSYTEKLNLYDDLSYEKALTELKLLNEGVTHNAHAAALKQYRSIEERYPLHLSNEEIDRLLTSMVLRSNLTPVRLGISETSSSGRTKDGDGPSDAFVILTATMNLNGDYDSVRKLTDTVGRIHYIRISRLSFSFTQSANETGAPNIAVTFEITMRNNAR